jgi:hypothetical protein
MLERISRGTTIRIATTWTPLLARNSKLCGHAVNGAFDALLYEVGRRAHTSQLTIEVLLCTRDGPAAKFRAAELPGFDAMLFENYCNAQALLDIAKTMPTLNVHVKLSPIMPEISYYSVDDWTDFGFFLPRADASESLRYRVTSTERAGAHLREMFHRAWNRASNIRVLDFSDLIRSSEMSTGLGDIKWTC